MGLIAQHIMARGGFRLWGSRWGDRRYGKQPSNNHHLLHVSQRCRSGAKSIYIVRKYDISRMYLHKTAARVK